MLFLYIFRENDRSSTWYDWKESVHHVKSDTRKKIYRDRRKTRTLPIDNGHEWKSKRGTNKFDIPRLLTISKMLHIYVHSPWFYHLSVNTNFGRFYCGKDLQYLMLLHI